MDGAVMPQARTCTAPAIAPGVPQNRNEPPHAGAARSFHQDVRPGAYSSEMASTGHSPVHRSQSVHFSGSIL